MDFVEAAILKPSLMEINREPTKKMVWDGRRCCFPLLGALVAAA